MKNHTLHIGRALGIALFILLLNLIGLRNLLAQTQVATLQHGDSITGVYYGVNALVSAHTAATDGDVITLSEGAFNSCTITKGITLRGAGCQTDTMSNTNETVIAAEIILNVSNSSNSLIIEGISFPTGTVKYGKLTNPRFIKCYFNFISSYSIVNMSNAQFVNCIIKRMSFSSSVSNTTFINSVIGKAEYLYNNVVLYNTIMSNYIKSNNSNSTIFAYNSILICTDSSGTPPTTSSSFFNCIGIKTNGVSPFGIGSVSNCITYASYAAVFESFNGTFTFDEQYLLKNEIATGFLGNDGTQVGIHGGSVPYDPRPSYMVVKRYNVANKSTHDGILSVEIELIPEEE